MLRISVRGNLSIYVSFIMKNTVTAPGRGIENVLFKNISYTGENAELSIIEGYDEKRKVKNIVLKI